MTKAELIERIIDIMVDPYTDAPEDYIYATPVDIDGAEDLMAQIRSDEDDADLEPGERMPAETTPAIVMEAYNCLIRAKKHEYWVERLADFITDTDQTCLYCNYYGHPEGVPDVFPTDFLFNIHHVVDCPFTPPFPLDIAGLIKIGQNSSELNMNSEYCYYDAQKNALVSVYNPFSEGIYDAKAFAGFILSPDGRECLEYLLDCMCDDEVKDVFHCTREEVLA